MSTNTPMGEYRGPGHRLAGRLDRFEARLDAFMLRTWGAQAVLVVVVAVIGTVVLFSPIPRPRPHLPGLPALPHPTAVIEWPARQALHAAGRLLRAHVPSITDSKPAAESKPAPAAATATCPSLATVRAQVGATVNTFSDACGFHWQGASVQVRCPSGYLCTFDLGSKIAVMIGNGQSVRISGAGTWRYAAAYPPETAGHSPCALLTYERQYAQQHDPGTPVVADGFRCGS